MGDLSRVVVEGRGEVAVCAFLPRRDRSAGYAVLRLSYRILEG